MRLRTILKNIIGKSIELIERYELRHIDTDENDIDKKIVETQELYDIQEETDNGYSPVSYIHKTQPYRVYELILDGNIKLECADNHIIFNDKLEEIYVKDLRVGDNIFTKHGIKSVISIDRKPYKLCMYDLSVEDFEHRYYTNDILSHNTTTTVSFIAWYLCFHTDRNIAVLANKQDTAIEIVNKLTEVFRGLPFFLKPGLKSIGKKGMTLDNASAF